MSSFLFSSLPPLRRPKGPDRPVDVLLVVLALLLHRFVLGRGVGHPTGLGDAVEVFCFKVFSGIFFLKQRA